MTKQLFCHLLFNIRRTRISHISRVFLLHKRFNLCSGGFILLSPAYRSKHLQKLMWRMSFDMALDGGFHGIIGRAAISAKTPIGAYKAGWQFTGCIPRALKVHNVGWMPDLIGIRDFSTLMTSMEKEKVYMTLDLFTCRMPYV